MEVSCAGVTSGGLQSGRLLFNLVSDSFNEPISSELTQAHMQSAFYDLLGALLGASGSKEISRGAIVPQSFALYATLSVSRRRYP